MTRLFVIYRVSGNLDKDESSYTVFLGFITGEHIGIL